MSKIEKSNIKKTNISTQNKTWKTNDEAKRGNIGIFIFFLSDSIVMLSSMSISENQASVIESCIKGSTI